MNKKIYDLIIIGAGPVGLYSMFIAQYMQLDILCIEKDEHYGGQLTKLYPSKMVHDFPGFPAIKANDIIDILAKQANVNNDNLLKKINIISYEIIDNGIIKLIDQNGNSYCGRNVLFTIGPGAFEFVKIDNEYLDGICQKSITYCFNYETNLDNKNVVIFGGGDSALDYAVEIKNNHNPKSVSIVHRSDKLRGLFYTLEKLNELNINVYLNTKIKKITSNSCYLVNDKNEFNLDYEFILVQFGVNSIGSDIHKWTEFKFEKNRFITDIYQQTSITNFYAAGNCAYKEYKIDMIVTGIAEATIALNHIHYKIKKNNKPHY